MIFLVIFYTRFIVPNMDSFRGCLSKIQVEKKGGQLDILLAALLFHWWAHLSWQTNTNLVS